jgi:Zn-finger nucleic acid-binding protein
MRCPVCSTELRAALRQAGVVLSCCPRGHGVWLSREALDRALAPPPVDDRGPRVAAWRPEWPRKNRAGQDLRGTEFYDFG